jgi:sugar diacid utilization regulator
LPEAGKFRPEGARPVPEATPGQTDLAAITRAASREAGGIPAGLLGDYLTAVLGAATSGRRLTPAELAGYARTGEQAAESGIALRGLVDLFLSATWRLWRELPGAGMPMAEVHALGLAVLRAADDAVAAAAEGFERAHLSVARRGEAERREFFDDLLSGRGTVGDLVTRGERLGLRLAGRHQVVLAGPALPAGAMSLAGMQVASAAAAAAAPSPCLVTTRAGHLVAIVGTSGGGEAGRVARTLARAAEQIAVASAPGAPVPWRVAAGRPYPGPSGVVRSYEEATDALEVAQRIGLPDPVVNSADLLVYQVLLRDRAAISDLVGAVLTPLEGARGGAGPLLATLAAYFGAGGVAVAAARELHLSVRAVTYRLARVAELTGHDPAEPSDALTLQIAVTGARLLGWPETPLEPL